MARFGVAILLLVVTLTLAPASSMALINGTFKRSPKKMVSLRLTDAG